MSLFEEAVADAVKLREVAEQSAKQKILDNITPKIRQIIEQELVSDEPTDELDDEVDIDGEDETVLTMDDILVGDEEETPPSGNIDIDVQGDATFAFSTDDVEMGELHDDDDEDDEVMTLNQESARALAHVIKNRSIFNQSKIKQLQEKINKLDRVLEFIEGKNISRDLRESVRKSYIGLIKEVTSLRRRAILTKRANEKKLLRSRFNGILKEFKTMSRRRAETLFNRLFETKRSLGELDVVLDDEDLETLGVEDVEGADVTALDVAVEYGGEEEEVEEEFEEEEVEVEEGDMYEAGLDELDLVLDDEDLETLGVEDVEGADVTALDVAVEYGGEEEEVEVGEEEEEEVLEIDEGMLRRELRRMRRLREQEEAADADPYLDHGGEDLGDVVVDVDEDDLLNALADELGDPDVPTPTVESFRRRRARRQTARRRAASRSRQPANIRESRTRQALIKESRKNRALTGKLGGAKRVISAMKNQLNEMNLFNAKLLYVNKLMQNRNLSTKQQKAIVEALDSAKTLREAKLLYKSLTVSLKKRGGALTEGRIARTLGSSSRSIRSAAPPKSGTEVDRWAVLAGINQD